MIWKVSGRSKKCPDHPENVYWAYLDHAYAQNLAKPPLMRICRKFENRRDLPALSGKFLRQKSCYPESFRFLWPCWPHHTKSLFKHRFLQHTISLIFARRKTLLELTKMQGKVTKAFLVLKVKVKHILWLKKVHIVVSYDGELLGATPCLYWRL